MGYIFDLPTAGRRDLSITPSNVCFYVSALRKSDKMEYTGFTIINGGGIPVTPRAESIGTI